MSNRMALTKGFRVMREWYQAPPHEVPRNAIVVTHWQ